MFRPAQKSQDYFLERFGGKVKIMRLTDSKEMCGKMEQKVILQGKEVVPMDSRAGLKVCGRP